MPRQSLWKMRNKWRPPWKWTTKERVRWGRNRAEYPEANWKRVCALRWDICQTSRYWDKTFEDLSGGGKIYLDSWFQRFQPMVSWLRCFLAVVTQETVLDRVWPWWLGSREWDRRGQTGCLETYFLQQGISPMSHHILNPSKDWYRLGHVPSIH